MLLHLNMRVSVVGVGLGGSEEGFVAFATKLGQGRSLELVTWPRGVTIRCDSSLPDVAGFCSFRSV